MKLLRPTLLAALALAAAALLAVPAAPADDKKGAKDKERPKVEKTEEELASEALLTAHDLAAFGRRTKTAEALATAALMLAKTPYGGVEAPKDKPEGGGVRPYDPKEDALGLLAEAKAMDPKGTAVTEIAAKVSDLHRERPRDVRAISGKPNWYRASSLQPNRQYKVRDINLAPGGGGRQTAKVYPAANPGEIPAGNRLEVTLILVDSRGREMVLDSARGFASYDTDYTWTVNVPFTGTIMLKTGPSGTPAIYDIYCQSGR
jgi:hypothetical protein